MKRSQKATMLRMRSVRSAITLLASALPHSTAYSNGDSSLITRDNTAVCANDNVQACPASMPFCCSKGTTCISLVPDNSAVLCCPDVNNQGCAVLQPVNCTMSLQDQSQNPYYLLHSTNLDTTLESCGEGTCCPLGYTCKNNTCVRDSATPTSTTSTVAAGETATSSVTPVTLPTVLGTGSQASSSKVPAATILIGVLSGLLGVVLLALLFMWLLRKRRERRRLRAKVDYPSTYSSKAPTCVSDPIEAKTYGSVQRTDFLLRTSPRHEMSGGATLTPDTFGSKKRTPLFPAPLRFGLPVNPSPPHRPGRESGTFNTAKSAQPDVQQAKRDEPNPGICRTNSDESYITTGTNNPDERPVSSETIDVLMPPSEMHGRGAVMSGATTFSEMMAHAGMKRGNNHLGYPGRWSMTKR